MAHHITITNATAQPTTYFLLTSKPDAQDQQTLASRASFGVRTVLLGRAKTDSSQAAEFAFDAGNCYAFCGRVTVVSEDTGVATRVMSSRPVLLSSADGPGTSLQVNVGDGIVDFAGDALKPAGQQGAFQIETNAFSMADNRDVFVGYGVNSKAPCSTFRAEPMVSYQIRPSSRIWVISWNHLVTAGGVEEDVWSAPFELDLAQLPLDVFVVQDGQGSFRLQSDGNA